MSDIYEFYQPELEEAPQHLTTTGLFNHLIQQANRLSQTFDSPKGFSLLLLYLNKWNYEKVQTLLLQKRDQLMLKYCQGQTCSICLQKSDEHTIFCHQFCKRCIVTYLQQSSLLRYPVCPEQTCQKQILYEDLVNRENMKIIQNFKRFLSRNFILLSKDYVACNQNFCQFFSKRLSSQNFMACRCGSSTCVNCRSQDHRPASCLQFKKWIKLLAQSALSLQWIMSNAKSCPKCKAIIQRNKGCNHMTCQICMHQFCWICQGNWQEHSKQTGGFYKCNKYDGKKIKKFTDKSNDNQKLFFYKARFDIQNNSLEHCRRLLPYLINARDKAMFKFKIDAPQLQFIIDAGYSVIRGRFAMKWSYVRAFYNGQKNSQLFQHHQGLCQLHLEQLQGLLEGELRWERVQDLKSFKQRVLKLQCHLSKFIKEFVV